MGDCYFKKPQWLPDRWNSLHPDDLKITNCYSYAFDRIEKNHSSENTHKPQPGELSNSSLNNRSCKNIIANVEDDLNIKLEETSLTSPIKCNHYRIAIVLDNSGEYKDYHFYRQDSDGLWSHKQGKGKVKRFDASKNLIYDPKKANRNYSKDDNGDKYNYEMFCGYFSVPYHGGPFMKQNKI